MAAQQLVTHRVLVTKIATWSNKVTLSALTDGGVAEETVANDVLVGSDVISSSGRWLLMLRNVSTAFFYDPISGDVINVAGQIQFPDNYHPHEIVNQSGSFSGNPSAGNPLGSETVITVMLVFPPTRSGRKVRILICVKNSNAEWAVKKVTNGSRGCFHSNLRVAIQGQGQNDLNYWIRNHESLLSTYRIRVLHETSIPRRFRGRKAVAPSEDPASIIPVRDDFYISRLASTSLLTLPQPPNHPTIAPTPFPPNQTLLIVDHHAGCASRRWGTRDFIRASHYNNFHLRTKLAGNNAWVESLPHDPDVATYCRCQFAWLTWED